MASAVLVCVSGQGCSIPQCHKLRRYYVVTSVLYVMLCYIGGREVLSISLDCFHTRSSFCKLMFR